MVFRNLPGVKRPAGVEIQIGFHSRLAFWWNQADRGTNIVVGWAATGIGTTGIPVI